MGFEIAQGLVACCDGCGNYFGMDEARVYVFFGRAEAKQALADKGWTLEPITGDIYCPNCAEAAKNVKEAVEAKYPFNPSGVLPKDSKTEMHAPKEDDGELQQHGYRKDQIFRMPSLTFKKRFFKKVNPGEADMPVAVAELFWDGDDLIEVLPDGTVTRYTKAHLVGVTRVMDPDIVTVEENK